VSLSQITFHEAVQLHQQGQWLQAQIMCEQILVVEPKHADALHLLGVIAYQMSNPQHAIDLISRAIDIDSTQAAFYSNRGSALQALMQLTCAVQDYDRAIAIQPDFADAYFNRGNALLSLMQFGMAVESYNDAIKLEPDFAAAFFNRGIALQELRQLQPALESYDSAIRLNPNYAEAYADRATVLVKLRQLDDAITAYEKAISINSHVDYLFGALLFTKMKLCDWSDFNNNITELVKRIENNEKSSAGFPTLSLITSPAIQRHAAEIWLNDRYPFNDSLGAIPKILPSNKIRIGYFSGDFHSHPVLILLAELFEQHDKNRFELVAFSFGPDDNDEMRQRARSAFDHFIDVREQSDKAVALLAREMGITIAVDLGGATASARPGIFSYRAAPIQVNFLGYPGTMGADYIDYLIADKTIIPDTHQQHYAEKIVYLPSYQPNDSTRIISNRQFTKQELGLPEEGFVFCCFNDNYKITPSIFDSWMQILKAAEGSVLFLYADASTAEHNLRKQADARGVDSGRLIFAERVPNRSDYLARYKCVDLFLDTTPYNAHATASDALWAGLPVLTLAGETFASRVAASLLNAIGLPELITHTQAGYEALAIELATNPIKLGAIKEKLTANRLTTPLFNTVEYAKHIENAYTQMVERYQAGLPPDHIYAE
jgi:predicted O-linked N-acetylglucosamine transferase (SPINDLY family)